MRSRSSSRSALFFPWYETGAANPFVPGDYAAARMVRGWQAGPVWAPLSLLLLLLCNGMPLGRATRWLRIAAQPIVALALAIYQVELREWVSFLAIVTPLPAERVFNTATAFLMLLPLGLVVERARGRRPGPSEER